MSKHKQTMLLGVAVVILTGFFVPVEAVNYEETWCGDSEETEIVWNSLTYNGESYSFLAGYADGCFLATHQDGQGTDAITNDDLVWWATFINDTYECDTITLYGWDYVISGSKETGRTGQKEGSGTLYIKVKHRLCDAVQFFYCGGSWDTEGSSYDFDYSVTPPEASLKFEIDYISTSHVLQANGYVTGIFCDGYREW